MVTNSGNDYIILEYDIESIELDENIFQDIIDNDNLDNYLEKEIDYLKKNFRIVEVQQRESQLIIPFTATISKKSYITLPIRNILPCNKQGIKYEYVEYKEKLQNTIINKQLEALKNTFEILDIDDYIKQIKSNGIIWSCPICGKNNQKLKTFADSGHTHTFSKTDCIDDKHQKLYKQIKTTFNKIWKELVQQLEGFYNLNIDYIKDIVRKYFPIIKRHKISNDLYYYDEKNNYYKPFTDDKNNSLLNQQLRKYIFTIENKKLVSLTINQLNNIKSLFYDCIAPKAEFPDMDNYINVKNGIYDIKAEKLIPHSPEIFTTYQININYNENIKTKNLDEIMNQWGVDSEEIKKLWGYGFTTDFYLEKYFALVGLTRSGKGTMLSMMFELMKSRITSTSLEDIYKNFKPTNLENCTIFIDPDLDADFFLTHSIKPVNKFIDGSELTFDRKYKDSYTMTGNLKLIIACNEIPRMKSGAETGGLWSRTHPIKFDNQFRGIKNNPNLKFQIKNDSDLRSEMLNYLIEGILLYKNWDRKSEFFEDKSDLIIEYQKDSNTTIDFILSNYEKIKDPEEKIHWTDIYKHYQNIAYEEGFAPLQSKKLKKMMKEYLEIPDQDFYKNVRIDGQQGKGIKNIRRINNNNTDNKNNILKVDFDT